MSAAEEVSDSIDENAPVLMSIGPAGIKAEFTGKNGRKVYKNIGLASMSKVLNRDAEFDTGFLPLYGRNYMGIKRYVKSPDREIILIEASPSNRSVKHGYDRDDFEELHNVRFPGMVMSVILRTENNGSVRVSDTRLFATKAPIMRESDMLCRFPLGNVYQPDGRVCWGSAEGDLGRIKNLTQAGSLLDSFLFSAMNNDLYGSGSINPKDNVYDHLTSLKDVSEYPYGELMDEISVKDLLNLLKSKNAR